MSIAGGLWRRETVTKHRSYLFVRPKARRVVQHVRRLKTRVEAVEHLRRTLDNAVDASIARFDPGP